MLLFVYKSRFKQTEVQSFYNLGFIKETKEFYPDRTANPVPFSLNFPSSLPLVVPPKWEDYKSGIFGAPTKGILHGKKQQILFPFSLHFPSSLVPSKWKYYRSVLLNILFMKDESDESEFHSLDAHLNLYTGFNDRRRMKISYNTSVCAQLPLGLHLLPSCFAFSYLYGTEYIHNMITASAHGSSVVVEREYQILRFFDNVISVYETENFTLIDKKSLKVENVLDFSWSPADPIIALFVPELDGGNIPARVSLVQIPGKEELRQKNLFSVVDWKMYWQCNGEYLAVKTVRYTKTRKSTYASFELFRMREREIPIEVLELENKNDNIMAFAWEPKGHRFAIIHGDARKVDVSFYSMRTATCTGRVSKLTTLQGKNASALHWSPSGRFIVLAGLNGQLEFYDVEELETMATAEHFMATNIEWDPTGRYVATAVTSVHEMENGFNIWSFTGKLLYKIPKDHFHQFLWRPRPPSLLTAEMEEKNSKNLDEYSKKYETEDQDAAAQLRGQDREKRKMLQREWDSWINKWKQLHEEEKLERQLLRDGEATDDQEVYEAKEIEVEEILDVREEIVPYELDQE
ncbi:hypothetical protein MKW98_012723 [Papaver atlanticum]|uniref:Eukaryotic translation initiation factor 3 subunit B n=1 Tax=Papaver atlanticum TaxID=357466 RepID=A0AAD4SUA7_9MAGN|nr:hypothetical protein MKW98_012723 [Papaver atlanticum]